VPIRLRYHGVAHEAEVGEAAELIQWLGVLTSVSPPPLPPHRRPPLEPRPTTAPAAFRHTSTLFSSLPALSSDRVLRGHLGALWSDFYVFSPGEEEIRFGSCYHGEVLATLRLRLLILMWYKQWRDCHL